MQEIVELILHAVSELVIEFLIKGPGYVIVKIIRPGDRTDPDGCLVSVLGLMFWLVIGVASWFFFAR